MLNSTGIKMMWKLVAICLTVSILSLLAKGQATCADLFRPGWEVGDHWNVEVAQKMPTSADGWSAPVVWEYRVAAMETYKGEQVYIVDVVPVSGDTGGGARLWYRFGDRSVAAVEVRGRNEEVLMALSFDDAIPVATERSGIPFDSPVFPVEISSSERYEIKRGIGGGFVANVVLRQDAKRYSGELAFCSSLAGDDLIEIRCTQGGEVSFVQYWDESAPWPVCGENRNLRYWLVRE